MVETNKTQLHFLKLHFSSFAPMSVRLLHFSKVMGSFNYGSHLYYINMCTHVFKQVRL